MTSRGDWEFIDYVTRKRARNMTRQERIQRWKNEAMTRQDKAKTLESEAAVLRAEAFVLLDCATAMESDISEENRPR